MSTEADFKGDRTYSIDATGDVVVGDRVRFQRATFSGSYKKPKFEGYELVTALVVKDSYGADKQQHTFTLSPIRKNGTVDKETKLLIKGRNLYANGTWRKPWTNEDERLEALDEKHGRGSSARKARNNRIYERGF